MSWFLIYNIVTWTLRLIMVPIILRRRLPSTTALTWLMLIFFLPEVGVILYWLIGDNRLGRRRVRKRARIIGPVRTSERTLGRKSRRAKPEIDPLWNPVIQQAERGGFPIVSGNSCDLLANTNETIDCIIRDIDNATHHIHMLFYIFEPDATGKKVCEALVRARKRGVCCRLLVDHVGSGNFIRSVELIQELKDLGIEIKPILPVQIWRVALARIDLRNHRKLVIIDGCIGYAGSQNIIDGEHGDKRAGSWYDLMGRFTGPIVAQMQMIYLEDWLAETGEDIDHDDLFPENGTPGKIFAQTVATGPMSDSIDLPRVLLAGINAAQRKIIITTPYLVPDEPTMLALTMAADRGVEVILVVPIKTDHMLVDWAGRAYYEQLLEGGVKIHLYHKGLLHSKTMTIDDAFAVLGSSNMDTRSFYLNFEVNILLYGEEVTGKLRFAQLSYMNDSVPLTLDEWRQHPLHRQYFYAMASLFSPLL